MDNLPNQISLAIHKKAQTKIQTWSIFKLSFIQFNFLFLLKVIKTGLSKKI